MGQRRVVHCEIRMPFFLKSQLFDFAVGLDDLRDWTNNVQPHIPIYVGLRDLTVGFLVWLFNPSMVHICLQL